MLYLKRNSMYDTNTRRFYCSLLLRKKRRIKNIRAIAYIYNLIVCTAVMLGGLKVQVWYKPVNSYAPRRISLILWGLNVRFETLMAALKFNKIDGPHPFSLESVSIWETLYLAPCTSTRL